MKWSKFRNFKIVLLIIFACIIGISFLLQIFVLGGFSKSEITSVNINLMVSLFSILATVFLVDELIKKHNSRKRMAQYLSILRNNHKALANRLSIAFINLVTKDPVAKDLSQVLENLENYIGSNFISKPVKIIVQNPYDLLTPISKEVDYYTQCYRFKVTVRNEITEYLQRFASILPSEVFEVLLTIDDLLKDNMMSTPNDHNITLNTPLSSINFNPDDFVTIYSKIGGEILRFKKMAEN